MPVAGTSKAKYNLGGEIIRINAIIPAYNEQKNIGSVVLLAKKYADEVIVVENGSIDRTSEIAKLAGASVKRHQFNEGKGAALKSGFRVFSKHAVPLFSFRQKGKTIESEMLIDASRNYLRINEVEIVVKYFEDKLTLNLFFKGLNILYDLIFIALNPFRAGGLFHDVHWNY